jgi:hypothetical protein
MQRSFFKSWALLIALAQLLIPTLFVLFHTRDSTAPAAREEATDIRKLQHRDATY